MSKKGMQAFSAGMIIASCILGIAYFLSGPKEMTKAETAAETKAVTDESVQQHLSDKGQIAIPRKDYEKLIAEKESAVAKSGGTSQAKSQKAPADKPFTLTIKDGMSTADVAKELENAGIVSSARDYATFLVETGYHTKVRSGTYQLKQGMSFKQITKVLVK
ncbi:endolytic transglycosylase MltG [Metabacillus sp. RGM 3146]|uniref:endolytic transglycosylase MltG n=1 Tax=Metabacillus sp. RGM 3146 TaxID=3401092 RepID=UPI003B9C42FD